MTGSISLAKKSSGVGSEIPAGWYNYYFAPHRSGIGGDNPQYGTIILTPMNFAGASWILRRSNSTTAITEVKKIAVSTDIPTKTSQLTNDSSYIRNYSYYVNTHPENSPVLIPFVNNDIAFLLKRGGSVNIYYDNVEKSIDISNVFDGSPSYGLAINPTGTTEIVIVLNLHKTFPWNNTIYSDFGSAGWRAKDVKIEVINTNYQSDVWTEKYHNTNNGSGNVYVTMNHTPVGASNAGGGFNKVRFTFKTWNSATIFRISQLGIYNYGSLGSRETSMSRGIDDPIYRNITPNSNNTYDLGSSSNKWKKIYANNIEAPNIAVNKTLTNENLNNVTTPGFYNAGGGNSVTNKPSGVEHFGLYVVHGASGNFYTQRIFNDTTQYTRKCVNGTWGSWSEDKLTDTTYSNKTAANGGTDVSLVTTGEKYNWNNKTSNTGTITGVSVNGTSVATSGVANITNMPASILSGAIKNGVTATTQNENDNSTKVATTGYVDRATASVRGAENPIATILAYAGSEAPNGYLLCRGQAVSRTTYSLLFNVIGTQYGAGDGSSTFNLPDLQGKVIAGLDIVDSDFNVLGKTGGSKSVQLTKNQLPKIYGRMVMHGGEASTNIAGVSGDFSTSLNNNKYKNGGTEGSGANSKGDIILNVGNNEAHENKQPYNTLNYIIKAYSGTDVPVPVNMSSVKNVYDSSTSNVYSTEYVNTKVRGKKLWENPNPTSDFAPQTINFGSTNDYDFYKIVFIYHYNPDVSVENQQYNSQDVEIGYGFRFLYHGTYTPNIESSTTKGEISSALRPDCVCNHDSITFTKCYQYRTDESGKHVGANDYMIPVRIYGYYI